MRWYVELSRIGESGAADLYCVDAKQWQAALQETRKMRGESGPLSKLSIELMDDGYRAVDPALKTRYVVRKAPPDAPLATPGAAKAEQPAAAPAVAPKVEQPAAAPAAAPNVEQLAAAPAVAPKVEQLAAAPAVAPKVEQPAAAPAAAPKVEQPAAAPAAAPKVEQPAAAPAAAPKVEQPAVAPLVAAGAPGLAIAAPSAVPRPASSPPPAPNPGAHPAVTPTGAFPRVDPLPSLGGNGKPATSPPASEPAPPTEFEAPPTTGAPSAGPPQTAASAKGIVVPADAVPPPPEPVAPQPAASPPKMPSVRPTQPSMETVREPDFTLVRKREEDPKPEAPITYREYAYAVKPGTPRGAAEVLLWARYREVSARISERPKGKFIQLAVFDHVFEKRPLRPPLATLAWKDWRGDPVLQFPSESIPAPSSAPPPISFPPVSGAAPSSPASQPSAESKVEIGGFVEIGAREVRTQRPPLRSEPPAAGPAEPVAAPRQEPLRPETVAAPPRPAAGEPARPGPVRAEPATPAPQEPARPEATQAARVAAALGLQPPSKVAQPAVEPPPPTIAGEPPPPAAEPPPPTIAGEPPTPAAEPPPTIAAEPAPAAEAAPAEPAVPAAPASKPAESARIKSEPPIMRRRSGEDLIGELFERMHELHFMADMVSGAQFVLGVVTHMLPSELLLVHVFDINNGEFVVVRAHGPNADKLIMYRTPDSDPLMVGAMRRVRSLRVENADTDERYQGGRWEKTSCQPKSTLCGGVKQGGRYLGAIELVNPMGGGPFHDSEINALDYICEQFAEFLANRPIVLEADVVLPKS